MASDDLTPLLVFRAGSQQPKAVPLSLISRLEEIDCRRIEVSDGRHLVQYRDQLMPLLRVDTRAGIKQEGAQPILVFSDHGRSMGLVVDEIADIVEERLDIEVASDRAFSAMRWSREAPPRSSTSATICRSPSTIGSIDGT
jgi:two-component system chemotaxis sensor kinase CheA